MNISFESAGTIPWKLLQHWSDIKNKPYFIQLNITDRCNANCSWCSQKEQRNMGSELSFDECKRILAFFYRKGARAVSISGGGEPTVHPQFDHIIAEANSIGYKICLITNGILLGKKHNSNFNYINYSKCIIWSRMSVFDNIKHVSNFYDFCDNLSGVDCAASFVVTPDVNMDNVKRLCDIAQLKSNCTHVRFISDIFHSQGPAVQAAIHRVEEATKDYSKIICQTRTTEQRGHVNCWLPRLKPVIGADGYIYPCCGIQYQTNIPTHLHKMCRWEDWCPEIYYHGDSCYRCYYWWYNEILQKMPLELKHKDFI